MMLTRSRLTPASLADLTTLRPSEVRPVGSTGSVSEILRPGLLLWSVFRACERRAIVVGSAMAAPSMSKSAYLRPYALTTASYSAATCADVLHAWASSMPDAPPKEILTSPPPLRILVISSFCQAVRGSYAPNQLALQP